MMRQACITLVILAAANASGFLQAPDSVSVLKGQVEKSEVFQKKVSALCQKASDQAACGAKATNALFCQLLQRSKPDVAAQHCSAPVAHRRGASLLQSSATPQVKMEDMKMRIEGTAGFKEETVKMASAMGCTGVKKAANCEGYVQDVAFCLAFADQMKSFNGMDGVHEEAEHCKHIDQKLPELALFLQSKFSFVQVASHKNKAPEDELAKEMTHDLEMNFNKIAPFGKEDTAKELQDHAAKTQDTLVDAVENAEVAEIKRAVFRALTRLRAATIKEFDTIARLETQAIDAYNDAHHYRAENPLAHLHEDEAPVETDKLKSFH
jgi:hypothetical protein